MVTKIITTLFLLISITLLCHCQTNYEIQCVAERGEKGTQGKQEDKWAKKLIKKEYSKKEYNSFSGDIKILDDETILYDSNVLKIYNTCKYLKPIFQKGIIYPDIMTGSIPVRKGLITNQELNSLAFLSSPDSLQITDFEELKFIKISQKTKIFRFWLYTKGVINPTVCFLTLYNESANHKTDIATFINGSRLTFFIKGWIII